MKPMIERPVLPWYREPWPWILMLGPFVVIVAGVLTTYLAVVSSDGLVEDDYYKQGLAVNQRTARNQNASAMDIRAQVFSGGEQATLLRVHLQAASAFEFPDTLLLRISHPTRSGSDQSLILRGEGNGYYAGKLSSPLAGRWHLALEDEQRTWRLVGDWEAGKDPASSLQPFARKEQDGTVIYYKGR